MKKNIRIGIWCFILMTSPAIAGTPTLNAGDSPIEITADTLEVVQEKQQAVFRGHVLAVQKDIRLKADEMRVFYREQSKSQENAVSRIEVVGNVFLATLEETASGSRGEYNMDKKTIHLAGDVMLTRGKNVLKGSELEYNLATGKSTLSSPAAGSQTGDGRVRGIFIPDKKSKNESPSE